MSNEITPPTDAIRYCVASFQSTTSNHHKTADAWGQLQALLAALTEKDRQINEVHEWVGESFRKSTPLDSMLAWCEENVEGWGV